MRYIQRRFFTNEDGLNTVEIVLILAILIALALIFKNRIEDFIKSFLDSVIDKNKQLL